MVEGQPFVFPGERWRFPIRLTARVVAVGPRGVALIRRMHNGEVWYSLPGGGIEVNESAPMAAERELFEETGLAATVGRLLAVSEDGSHFRLVVAQYFWCDAPDADLTRGSGDEYRASGSLNRGSYEPLWVDSMKLPAALRPPWLLQMIPIWMAGPKKEGAVWHFGS